MRLLSLASARITHLLAAGALLFALAGMSAIAQPDPPDEAGRISFITGTVSVQPSGSDDWGQAYPNLPIGPGDRIFTDQDGRVEIQIGQSYLRIGPNTDITLVGDDPNNISFGVAQGAVHVRSFGFWPGQSLDVSTPNGDARLQQQGEMRIDVLPGQEAAIFTSLANGVLVSGAGGFGQELGNLQSLELAGINPVYPQWLQPNAPDYLDQWSEQRDHQIMAALSFQYVSPGVVGAAELDTYGDWVPASDYGPIWFPRAMPIGWQPYRYGHWINRDPWGWVWVEDEPWGYAPFHYGRWVSYNGRWGWVPGPREGHPVWSPALVVFAGGGGAGVAAWFPLGPGEPYRPWYHCSPRYIDQVNITNIHESRIVHVQTTYVNIVNVTNVTNITYVNRTIGVTAVRQQDFAAGRPVSQAVVAVDTRQFNRVQVVDQPAPVTRQSFISRPVAHPVPVAPNKPVFINQKGLQVSSRPGAQPIQPPVRQAPPAVRPLPGRTVVAAPANSRFQSQPVNNSNTFQQQNRPVNQQPQVRPVPPQPGRPAVQPGQPQYQQPARPQPVEPQRSQPPQPVQPQVQQRPQPPQAVEPPRANEPPANERPQPNRPNAEPPQRPAPQAVHPPSQPQARPGNPPKPNNEKPEKKDQKKEEKPDRN